METSERLASVETNIENIKEDVKEIKSLLNDQVKQQDRKFDILDKKFANKWVEKIVVALLIASIGLVVTIIKFLV